MISNCLFNEQQHFYTSIQTYVLLEFSMVTGKDKHVACEKKKKRFLVLNVLGYGKFFVFHNPNLFRKSGNKLVIILFASPSTIQKSNETTNMAQYIIENFHL